MRIALFTETFLPKIDGIATRLRNTVSQLQKTGNQVLIFAPGNGVWDFEGAQVNGMPGSRFPLYPELTLALPRASMRQKLSSFKPDIIHVADPVCLGVAGIYYSDVLKLPLVISYHTRLPQYLRYYGLSALEPASWKVMKLRHNKAQLNLCTSSVMVSELREHGVERVKLWPKAVDTERYHPRFASPEMRGWLSEGQPEAPLFLYVGRLSPEKGIERLRGILDAFPGSRLAIVGGGPSESKLKAYFANTSTFFAGYLSGKTLAAAMASVNALVLPSKTETLGLVLMEAMAAGSTVIGADAGGIPDIVRHEVNGFLFNPDIEGDLASVAKRVLTEPELCTAMRSNALEQSKRWSWSSATMQLLNFYEEAIDMPRLQKSPQANTRFRLAMKRAAIGSMKVFLS